MLHCKAGRLKRKIYIFSIRFDLYIYFCVNVTRSRTFHRTIIILFTINSLSLLFNLGNGDIRQFLAHAILVKLAKRFSSDRFLR